jgi:hypothetical protein
MMTCRCFVGSWSTSHWSETLSAKVSADGDASVASTASIVWILVWHRRRPPESLPQPAQMPPRARYLLHGLIWLGVGFALTLAVHDWFGSRMGGFGWIAVAVGAAYLIFYFVEGRRNATVSEHEAPPSGSDQTH